MYYIINARKGGTCSISSTWNRVGQAGNDASIPNFPALPSRVNTPYKFYIYKYIYKISHTIYTIIHYYSIFICIPRVR